MLTINFHIIVFSEKLYCCNPNMHIIWISLADHAGFCSHNLEIRHKRLRQMNVEMRKVKALCILTEILSPAEVDLSVCAQLCGMNMFSACCHQSSTYSLVPLLSSPLWEYWENRCGWIASSNLATLLPWCQTPCQAVLVPQCPRTASLPHSLPPAVTLSQRWLRAGSKRMYRYWHISLYSWLGHNQDFRYWNYETSTKLPSQTSQPFHYLDLSYTIYLVICLIICFTLSSCKWSISCVLKIEWKSAPGY